MNKPPQELTNEELADAIIEEISDYGDSANIKIHKEAARRLRAIPEPTAPTNDVAGDAGGFLRETRYRVIKLKTGKPVDCVVVEADWPMYETVWKMVADWSKGFVK